MAESLRHKTFQGTIWSFIDRFSVQGIMFVVMILMARVLTPADYGLVGMLTIFIAISQTLVDSGFSPGAYPEARTNGNRQFHGILF